MSESFTGQLRHPLPREMKVTIAQDTSHGIPAHNGVAVVSGSNVRRLPSDTEPVSKNLATQRKKVRELTGLAKKWLSERYDIAAQLLMLGAAVGHKLDGDPAWLLIVAGASTAKTETVTQLRGYKSVFEVSTLTSEAALLSGSGKDDHDSESTGGLLKEIGKEGILVIKDFTSILSLHPNAKASVIAALREVYDGQWDRATGSDGGKLLSWSGRLIVVGAVTTAWDRAYSVVSEMGDRFVLLRLDSTDMQTRLASGQQAIDNIAHESEYRKQLSGGVRALLECADAADAPTLTDSERRRILEAANVATYARTAVETDFKGNVVDAHAPEGPARLTKQLTQLFRGLYVVGVPRKMAMRLVLRCARDCIPPMRLQVLEYLAENPNSRTGEVRRGLNKPHATVDRAIQQLVALGLVEQVEQNPCERVDSSKQVWEFRVKSASDVKALRPNKSEAAPSRSGNNKEAEPVPPAPGVTSGGDTLLVECVNCHSRSGQKGCTCHSRRVWSKP